MQYLQTGYHNTYSLEEVERQVALTRYYLSDKGQLRSKVKCIWIITALYFSDCQKGM